MDLIYPKKKDYRNRRNKTKQTRKIRAKQISGGNVGKHKGKGGIFCYMPCNSLDKKNKSTFKIESGRNITGQIKKFLLSPFSNALKSKATNNFLCRYFLKSLLGLRRDLSMLLSASKISITPGLLTNLHNECK
jgi:hypothetical protein